MDYREDLTEFAEALEDLMADLEDIRDDVMEAMEEENSPQTEAYVNRIDAAMALLAQAATLLEAE